jgi:hemolysin III
MKRIFREPVNSLTHWAGAGLAAAGTLVLLVQSWVDMARAVSLTIYGLSLVSMFAASATYHMVRVKSRSLEVFRKIDHSAIYLLIAGTYTPICFNYFTGYWKWGMLITIWSLALVGIAIKIFIIRVPRWLNAGIYILMGWISLAAIGQMALVPAWVLGWILAGGILYTLGALVYITKIFNFVPGVFGFHEVWHIFVLAAAAAHFLAVLGVALRI